MGALIFDSVGHLLQGLATWLGLQYARDGCEVVRIENRFREPTPLGWRDISLLLKVKCPNALHHIMEIQLQLRGLMKVRNEAHDFYEKIRGILPESAVDVVID